MSITVEEFARELGGKADTVAQPVLEALAELPGSTGRSIREIAKIAFEAFDPDIQRDNWRAYNMVWQAVTAVLHVGPDDWMPNLIKAMEPCDPAVVSELQALMRALKKARRAVEERDYPGR